MFLYNAKIITITNGVIKNGYINIENGKIKDIGDMDCITINEEENGIDLCENCVYPGFIDAHTHIGMWEDGLTFEGDDGNEDTDPATPHLRAIDAINPMDRCFEEAYQAGVTTVITGPGSANPIGGQMLAMKTFGKRVDKMIIQAPIAIKFALGENPKNVYHGKSLAPVTRMGTASIIREMLQKAVRYDDDIKASQDDPENFDVPEYDIKCEALLPLLHKKIKAHFHCHRADDIFTAIRIAKEFDIDYVLVHCTEGGLIADELAEENVMAFSGPILCDRSKPEMKNLTPKTPSIMVKAGINTSIITDHPVIPIQYLPLCVGLAVREGLGYEDALKSITINPAKACGIDNRVGSIEVGKDADLVVFSDNPLDLYAKPELVIVNGEIVHTGEINTER